MNPMFYSGTNQNVDFELWLLLSFSSIKQLPAKWFNSSSQYSHFRSFRRQAEKNFNRETKVQLWGGNRGWQSAGATEDQARWEGFKEKEHHQSLPWLILWKAGQRGHSHPARNGQYCEDLRSRPVFPGIPGSQEKNTPLRLIVETGLIFRHVDFLKSLLHSLQLEAAWTLTNIPAKTWEWTWAIVEERHQLVLHWAACVGTDSMGLG